MGLSKSKTVSQSGPSTQAMPYLQAGSNAIQGAYDANQGNLSNIGQGLTSAFQAQLARMQGGDPTVSAARGYTSDVLGGKYLGESNPYTADIIRNTNNDITDSINAIFTKSGQTGSSRQIGELGKQLSANESALRYNDYNTERGRMDSAVGNAAGLHNLDNTDLEALIGAGNAAATTPYLGAQFLAGGLGGLWGDSKTQTQTTSPSILGMLIKGASNAAASAAAGG